MQEQYQVNGNKGIEVFRYIVIDSSSRLPHLSGPGLMTTGSRMNTAAAAAAAVRSVHRSHDIVIMTREYDRILSINTRVDVHGAEYTKLIGQTVYGFWVQPCWRAKDVCGENSSPQPFRRSTLSLSAYWTQFSLKPYEKLSGIVKRLPNQFAK